jgi:hypothetical protein
MIAQIVSLKPATDWILQIPKPKTALQAFSDQKSNSIETSGNKRMTHFRVERITLYKE